MLIKRSRDYNPKPRLQTLRQPSPNPFKVCIAIGYGTAYVLRLIKSPFTNNMLSSVTAGMGATQQQQFSYVNVGMCAAPIAMYTTPSVRILECGDMEGLVLTRNLNFSLNLRL
jgi:hypothetical protein